MHREASGTFQYPLAARKAGWGRKPSSIAPQLMFACPLAAEEFSGQVYRLHLVIAEVPNAEYSRLERGGRTGTSDSSAHRLFGDSRTASSLCQSELETEWQDGPRLNHF